jgi:DNA-directed RNA polymerase specialized sigma24 family protein
MNTDDWRKMDADLYARLLGECGKRLSRKGIKRADLRGHDPEDFLQETLTKLLETCTQVRDRQGHRHGEAPSLTELLDTLTEIEDPLAWCATVTRNRAIDEARKRPLVHLAEDEEIPSRELPPPEARGDAPAGPRSLLESLAHHLSPGDMDVLEFLYRATLPEEKTDRYRVVAEALGRPSPEAVKQAVYRIRTAIRDNQERRQPCHAVLPEMRDVLFDWDDRIELHIDRETTAGLALALRLVGSVRVEPTASPDAAAEEVNHRFSRGLAAFLSASFAFRLCSRLSSGPLAQQLADKILHDLRVATAIFSYLGHRPFLFRAFVVTSALLCFQGDFREADRVAIAAARIEMDDKPPSIPHLNPVKNELKELLTDLYRHLYGEPPGSSG